MADKNHEHDQELISCNVCLKSIPRSEAKNVETEDYVAHFCGLDCYDEWTQKDQKNKAADKS